MKEWVQKGCRSAGIGCLECKQPVIDAVLAELKPIRERSQEYLEDPDAVRAILDEGCEKAQEVARQTLEDVREAMGLVYR
jgi:tryptophanyl-tRNA synthetase